MPNSTEPLQADSALICHLIVAQQQQYSLQRNQRVHFVDALHPLAIAPLREWDRTRRAEGRPPALEEFLEAYWLGFGFLMWLAGFGEFFKCGKCYQWIEKRDLATHAERCALAVTQRENVIPDPPEEIYLCPDEECGFWDTEYTKIRAPHRSKAHGGTHISQSFILEDDPDVILDLWMQRYTSEVRDIFRCELCDTTISDSAAALEHFLERHTTPLAQDDIWGRLIAPKDRETEQILADALSRRIQKQGIEELIVAFSPSFQRIYRDVIARGNPAVANDADFSGILRWAKPAQLLIDAYQAMSRSPQYALDAGPSSKSAPAVPFPGKKCPIRSQTGHTSTMKIRLCDLIHQFSS
ncbi:MAG TPA: hypothetical protein PK395_10835 [bacterium]|mgnify:FL=1|nr:hypothetical protein [bacterium]